MRRLYLALWLFLVGGFLFAGAGVAAASGNVRSITLPHFEPVMPAAPGRDEFMRTCLPCHSPRYITMQPPFAHRQWEDIVRKMTNAYGATLDVDQVAKVTDYLFAINGNGPKPRAQDSSADDDDDGGSPAAKMPEVTEGAPVLEVAVNADDRAASLRRGATLFAQNCAGCHGAEGRGDGIVSQSLTLRPANLTRLRFSIEFLRQTLWNGVRGTPMPSWRNLPLSDLNAVTAYVQSLHASANEDTASPASSDRASALFQKNCAPCHGAAGDGKGANAAALAPPPFSFKLAQPDFNYALQVLREGIPGTAMPAWKAQISEGDCSALASYVRSFYQSTNAGEK